MEHYQDVLNFSLIEVSPNFGYATIKIPTSYVKKLYTEASFAQQSNMYTQGFLKGTTPLAYIERNFQPHILEHVKEFFFKYFVINWLYKELFEKKILLAGEPRLTEINLEEDQSISYKFSLTLMPSIELQGWKRIPFKAPRRKNYKDLDRQVANFLKAEQEITKAADIEKISIGDWVRFSIILLTADNKPLFSAEHTEELWLKVGTEEVDEKFHELFVGKKIGDSFIVKNHCIQTYFSTHLDTQYPFLITVLDFSAFNYFNIEHFKKHFRIKNNQELHQKLIETFSYRNDISQRRSMAEETLKLLLSRHIFEVPNHLILRKQKDLLEKIYDNPDYHVYKMRPDFEEKIRLLAIEQIKEMIFIHQLAFYEDLDANDQDVLYYLNLTKRPRTREFIYFEQPLTKVLGQESPISSSLLKHYALKEKALNHAIYHLTKQKIK